MKRYAAPILVDVEYTQGSHDNPRKERKVFEHYCNMNLTKQNCIIIFSFVLASQTNVVIGRMPIMLRSSCCVLYGRDEAELAKLGSYGLEAHIFTFFVHFFFLLTLCVLHSLLNLTFFSFSLIR